MCKIKLFNFKSFKMERWPSGLRRTLGKCVYCQRYRGFESHPLRHPPTHAGEARQRTQQQAQPRAAMGPVPRDGVGPNRVRPGTEQP